MSIGRPRARHSETPMRIFCENTKPRTLHITKNTQTHTSVCAQWLPSMAMAAWHIKCPSINIPIKVHHIVYVVGRIGIAGEIAKMPFVIRPFWRANHANDLIVVPVYRAGPAEKKRARRKEWKLFAMEADHIQCTPHRACAVCGAYTCNVYMQ